VVVGADRNGNLMNQTPVTGPSAARPALIEMAMCLAIIIALVGEHMTGVL
jgi:hypothetical protein